MPHLYESIYQLATLNESSRVPVGQKQVMTQLLDGMAGQNGWKNLKELARTPTKQDIDNIKNYIEQSLHESTYFSFQFPHAIFKYKRALNNLMEELTGIQERMKVIENISKDKADVFHAYAKKMDFLFLESVHQFHGTLLLPLDQEFDVRAGYENGFCFGYIAEWGRCLLQNKPPFGVDVNSSPPFKPVKYNSAVGRAFPDLNHLGVITEKIITLQNLQRQQSLLSQAMSEGMVETEINSQSLNSIQFFTYITEVIDKIMAYLEKERSCTIYNLVLGQFSSGHAVGFCKKNGKYHFIDSNFAWISFDNVDDLKRWLPFYFQKMDYEKNFYRFEIEAYTLSPKKNAHDPDSLFSLARIAKKIVTAVIFPLKVLFYFPYAVLYLSHFLVQRVKIAIQRRLHSRQHTINSAEAMPSTLDHSQGYSKKSLDDWEVGGTQPKRSLPFSYRKIATLLDVSLQDVLAIQKRVARNPDFSTDKQKSPPATKSEPRASASVTVFVR